MFLFFDQDQKALHVCFDPDQKFKYKILLSFFDQNQKQN